MSNVLRKYKFKNDSKWIGERKRNKFTYNWYDWTVYLDEDQETLEEVKYVEYRLHPTFSDPIREIEDHSNKFAMKSAGWGDFRIFITVFLKNGEKITSFHDLKLG